MTIWLKVGFVAAWAVVVAVLLARGGRIAAFRLAVLLLPATGVFVDVGMSLSAGRIVQVALGVSVVATWVARGVTGRVQTLAVVFLLYGALVTLLGAAVAPSTPIGADDFRTQFRPAVQWASLALQMLPVFLAPAILQSRDDVVSVARAFLWGSAVLALGGVVHWLGYVLWDVNIFPIHREGLFEDHTEIGQFTLKDRDVFRANSLAREPKDMATALVVAIVGCVLLQRAGALKRSVATRAFLALALLATVLSFSTTAVVLGAMGVVILIAGTILMKLGRASALTRRGQAEALGVEARRRRRLGMAAAAALTLAFVVGVGARAARSGTGGALAEVPELWQIRVVERVGSLEEYDGVTVAFLLAEPQWAVTGVGSGNLPRFGFPYLPEDPVLLQYMTNLTWDAKSGLLKVVASHGFVGLAILAIVITSVVRRLLAEARRLGGTDAQWLIGLAWIVTFLSAVHVLRAIDDFLWLAIGVAAAAAQAAARPARAAVRP